MNLYIVENGEVTLLMTPAFLLKEIPDVDGYESILVYAKNKQQALKKALDYDKGLIEIGNVTLWNGKTVAAI